ncbi:NAD(P)-dependent oxidoreductase [Clostridium tertium]|uniref:precorrin-2 dehydrogenase n=1 Tax=Clostridium tertium TaxID=1559 RepID=A0A6N3BF93_9CLOT
MCKDIKEDISREDINYTYLATNSKKLRIGIVGGGRAGFIKAKSFFQRGSYVEVLSLEFIEDFNSLVNINLIKSNYYREFIKDKHVIVIATNDKELNLTIKNNCEEEFKLYIFAEDYKKSLAVTPVQRNLNNITFAVNTKNSNPKGALMLSDRMLEIAREYDDFISYSSIIRKNVKDIVEVKKEIINFVCSEDFKYIYEKEKDKLVLEMFFGRDVLNKIFKDL